jgi:hypothetical protein
MLAKQIPYAASKMARLRIARRKENEMKAITETGTALFVSPNFRDKPYQTFAALREHLVHSLLVHKAKSLVQSGYSYYAVTFASKADRDSGARILCEKPFIFEGRDIALTVTTLVELFSPIDTVCHFASSLSDTPKAVMNALEAYFESTSRKCPDFQLKRHVQKQVPLKMWTVKFAGRVVPMPMKLRIGSRDKL